VTIEKGDFVIAKVSGNGGLARGYGYRAYNRGDELLVTSVRPHALNVRHASGGAVFHVPWSSVDKPTRRIGEVPAGGIEIDDPRIQWIFEDAGRLADRFGYCRVYEQIAEQLGAPGRERTFTIKLAITDGIEVTAKVVARSKKLAEQELRSRFGASPMPEVKAVTAHG
jgi:hypothetical protein